MMKKVVIITLLNLIYLHVANSQEVKLKATSRNVVAVGETFQVKYTINVQGAKFYKPDFGNFRVLGITQMSGTNGAIVIINGQMVQNGGFEQTWLFDVAATKVGVYTINVATAEYKGKQYKSNSLKIEVVSNGGNVNDEQYSDDDENVTNTNIPKSGSGLFVDVSTSKSEVYIGEQIILSASILSKYQIAEFGESNVPTFTGFWSQDLYNPKNIQFERKNIGGQQYLYALWQKKSLIPQKAGELVIDKYELECYLGYWGFPEEKKTAVSTPQKIIVKPLPENKPEGFGGAVGNYTVSASIDKTELKLDEPLTLKLKVAGAGNFKLFEAPKLILPSAFENFEPKSTEDISASVNGISGVKTFDYVIIARAPGEFTINPVEFSFFDPSSKSYKTVKTQSFKVKVTGERDSTYTAFVSSTLQSDVENLGNDIQFIYKNDFELNKKNDKFFGSFEYYFAFIFMFAMFVIIIVLKRQQIKNNANLSLVRNKKAGKVSKKRLNLAHTYMKSGKNDAFYVEVLQAVWGYLSDKLLIPTALLTRDNVAEEMNKNKVDQELTDSLIQLLDKCEFARYAPAAASDSIADIYISAADIIDRLEHSLK